MLSTSHLALPLFLLSPLPLSPVYVGCVSLRLYLCASLSTDRSCWVFLLPHKQVPSYGYPPPPFCHFFYGRHTNTRDTPLILLSSLSERRRARSLARQSPASVPSLNVVMFSSKKSENNEGEKEWWTASPWNFEKGYKKRHTKELVGWCGVFFFFFQQQL